MWILDVVVVDSYKIIDLLIYLIIVSDDDHYD